MQFLRPTLTVPAPFLIRRSFGCCFLVVSVGTGAWWGRVNSWKLDIKVADRSPNICGRRSSWRLTPGRPSSESFLVLGEGVRGRNSPWKQKAGLFNAKYRIVVQVGESCNFKSHTFEGPLEGIERFSSQPQEFLSVENPGSRARIWTKVWDSFPGEFLCLILGGNCATNHRFFFHDHSCIGVTWISGSIPCMILFNQFSNRWRKRLCQNFITICLVQFCSDFWH